MNQPAIETTKTQIENLTATMLAEKLTADAAPIVTNKYLTNDNRLVYLTQCSIAESAVPRVRIQVFERVEGGVREISYALFSDHRFERSDNSMIFGRTQSVAPDSSTPVDEPTAQWLVTLLQSLPSQQQSSTTQDQA